MADVEKIALVTGDGRGIGKATALKLAASGYDIRVNYKSDAGSANDVVAEVKALGQRAFAFKADVANEADIVSMFEAMDTELGTLTALVNNAGFLLPQLKIVDVDADRINRLFAANVTGSFICCREAVKRMSTEFGGQGGAIVNVSSMAAKLGGANEYIDYAATKGAVDTLTKGLALEVAAQSIRVNAVRPGLIDTDMHADGGEPNRIARLKNKVPMQRGGTAEEVANVIVWLLSDDAGYCTGTFIDVSGGR